MDGTFYPGGHAADGFPAGSPGSPGQHPPGRDHAQPGQGGDESGCPPVLYRPGDREPVDHRPEGESGTDGNGPAPGPPDPESLSGTPGQEQPAGGGVPENRACLQDLPAEESPAAGGGFSPVRKYRGQHRQTGSREIPVAGQRADLPGKHCKPGGRPGEDLSADPGSLQ